MIQKSCICRLPEGAKSQGLCTRITWWQIPQERCWKGWLNHRSTCSWDQGIIKKYSNWQAWHIPLQSGFPLKPWMNSWWKIRPCTEGRLRQKQGGKEGKKEISVISVFTDIIGSCRYAWSYMDNFQWAETIATQIENNVNNSSAIYAPELTGTFPA